MDAGPIEQLEYEALVLGRHLADLPGRARRPSSHLDQSAYTLLNLLDRLGAASIGELSAITGLDASTLQRQTAALLRSEHAERIPDPDGGMARKFRMLPAGRAALETERAASREALHGLLDDWSEEDVTAMASLVVRFNERIERRTGRVWPRP